MNYNNPLVCIEGTDAAGKATVSAYLAAQLGATLFSFPAYGTPLGGDISKILRGDLALATRIGPGHYSIAADLQHAAAMRLRQSAMTVNRLEVQPAIVEALGRGPVVLDRWYASSMAYGAAEGLDPAWVAAVSATLLVPDLTIWLDVDPEIAAARRPARDLNEADLNKQRRAREAYRRLHTGAAPRESWGRVDASAPADLVCAAAMKAVADAGLVVGAATPPPPGMADDRDIPSVEEIRRAVREVGMTEIRRSGSLAPGEVVARKVDPT